MKIYFAGSIRGGRDDRELYQKMIEVLRKYGTVLTEHVGGTSLTSYGETQLTDKEIFERDVAWIKESDIIVAEVTTVSLGVGYELGRAETMGKPIFCFYRKTPGKRLSAMISGNSYIRLFEYQTIEDFKGIVIDYIK